MVPVPDLSRPDPVPDLARSERAAGLFLDALGVAWDTPGLCDTPRKMAHAYAELLSAREFTPTTFPNDVGYDQLVVARDIPFRSVCEHHFLPIVGRASVGYIPGHRIVGLSKLSRLVEMLAHRAQVQERLTMQVATWLQEHLQPAEVGVVLSAEHMCMTLRGAYASGSATVTSALLGSGAHRSTAARRVLLARRAVPVTVGQQSR